MILSILCIGGQPFPGKKRGCRLCRYVHRISETLTNLFRHINYLLLYVLFTSVWKQRRSDSYFIPPKNAKEIADILGFEDLSAFSRFFKNMTGESISTYRKRENGRIDNLSGKIAIYFRFKSFDLCSISLTIKTK